MGDEIKFSDIMEMIKYYNKVSPKQGSPCDGLCYLKDIINEQIHLWMKQEGHIST